MRLHLPGLFCLSLLLCPLPGAAHDTLPKDWCAKPHSLPVVVRVFQFNAAQLLDRTIAFEATHDHSIKPSTPGVISDACGIVDLWSWADLLAAGYCAEEVEGEIAMPLILGPRSFLEAAHHERYRFGDGLQGVCVVCEHR